MSQKANSLCGRGKEGVFYFSTIAAYIRVSATDQRTNLQRSEIEIWARASGIDPNKIKWFEYRISGKDTKRPSLEALQEEIFDDKIKTVII